MRDRIGGECPGNTEQLYRRAYVQNHEKRLLHQTTDQELTTVPQASNILSVRSQQLLLLRILITLDNLIAALP